MSPINLTWHPESVTRTDREGLQGHRGAIIWFTGLSGSGKSTLAHALEQRLYQEGHRTFVLDGDNVRHGLCRDLGFSLEDRAENIRRVGEVVQLFLAAGTIVLAAFISPLRKDRDQIRAQVPVGDFIEVYCNSSTEVCEQRDVKGLYARARAGKIPDFTGISSPYEAPENAELNLDTSLLDVEECVQAIVTFLQQQGVTRSLSSAC